MPTYEYHCDSCSNDFSKMMSISDHDAAAVSCPNCKTKNVRQRYSAFVPKTSKKS